MEFSCLEGLNISFSHRTGCEEAGLHLSNSAFSMGQSRVSLWPFKDSYFELSVSFGTLFI